MCIFGPAPDITRARNSVPSERTPVNYKKKKGRRKKRKKTLNIYIGNKRIDRNRILKYKLPIYYARVVCNTCNAMNTRALAYFSLSLTI